MYLISTYLISTMSLFIGSLAFEQYDSAYLNSVKIGVLAGSFLSAILGSYIIHRSLKKTQTTEELHYETA